MQRYARAFLRLPGRALSWWRRWRYVIGSQPSKLVSWGNFPDAPYRAVVFGLEEDMWDFFDAAYPEYEKAFAPPGVHVDDLRASLGSRNTALIVFDKAPRRHIARATSNLKTTIFYATYAPVPVLQEADSFAFGFLIDTVGDWQSARRPTEVGIFLENFDLDGRDALLADASAMQSSFQIASATGAACLIVADSADDNVALVQTANEVVEADDYILFRAHLNDPWYDRDVIIHFLERLLICETVVVHDSPLGLLACLAGRKVVVTGRPFWAGYGLTLDMLPIRRRRQLSISELIAMIMLVLSRYVDESGEIIDPRNGWELLGISDRSTENP